MAETRVRIDVCCRGPMKYVDVVRMQFSEKELRSDFGSNEFTFDLFPTWPLYLRQHLEQNA